MNFWKAKSIASKIGVGAFSKFIRDFKEKCPKTIISLGGHSLGARVILKALQSGKGVTGIHCTVLVAAAVDNESLGSKGEFRHAHEHTDTLRTVNSTEDNVLESAYSAAQADNALGETGPEIDRTLPGNIIADDMTKELKGGHSNYLHNQAFWLRAESCISPKCCIGR